MGDELARLTWSGRMGHDERPCPACGELVRIRASTSAQGVALCPCCDVRLYVTITYEWRDGRARLFRDRFRLERLADVQRATQAPYQATFQELWLDQWREAAGPGLLWAIPAAGLALALAGALPGWPLPGWLGASLGVVVPWALASNRLGRAHVAQQTDWRARSADFAQRLLAASPCAELESAGSEQRPGCDAADPQPSSSPRVSHSL